MRTLALDVAPMRPPPEDSALSSTGKKADATAGAHSRIQRYAIRGLSLIPRIELENRSS
jgi:hypothetical protein